MTQKLLVPVFPSEFFYDAVVGAADIVAAQGGTVTFLFTEVRPPEDVLDEDEDGRPSDKAFDDTRDTEDDPLRYARCQERQMAGLDEARALLYQRGIGDGQISYLWGDEADAESGAQAIADEAAAGAYDAVVMARGYFSDGVEDVGSPPEEVAAAVRSLEEVQLVVT